MKPVARATALLVVAATVGCFPLRPSQGGGQTTFEGPRRLDAGHVAVVAGYSVEVVASGLTFPTGVTFDAAGRPVIVEAGYAYGEVFTTPRLVRLEDDGALTVLAIGANPPWNGVDHHDGAFFVAEGGVLEGGRILRIEGDGSMGVLVEGLPSLGDHHTNGPVVHDGWVYFGQGTATNAGVVGLDSLDFGWLSRHPAFHDVPCADVTLTGESFETSDPRRGGASVTTGAFRPYGTPSVAGEVVPGRVPCNGAVMRVPIDGGEVELVAWGFRNPFGLAVAPDGSLYVTDNQYDVRGSRPVFGAGDLLWRVEQGSWHGWPDFHGDRPLRDADRYQPPGSRAPGAVLATPPGDPPRPAAVLAVHSSSNGLDLSRTEAFGFVGDAFVAQFGDMAPQVGKVLAPAGFRVVRVDVARGTIDDFLVNREGGGPASLHGSRGLERPVAARFDPDGTSLYVVDFGVMLVGASGPEPIPGTGALWRVTRATSR